MPQIPSDVPWTFVAHAVPIALEAGALLRRFYAEGVATEYKTDVDIVTEADRQSEALILSGLTKAFPEHGIFGEEGSRQRLDADYRWHVDPLDGTTNFSHGFPQFCVSLGLEHRPTNSLAAAVLYDPLRDELFVAEAGKGAYLNGRRVRVSKTPRLGEALLATGFPSKSRHASPNAHFYHEFTMRSHGVRRAGSAALDLAYVAAGRLDAYWEFRLNPWDTAAGALLVLEVGGKLTRFDGSPFRLSSEEVLATNGPLAGELLPLFADMFAGRNLHPMPTPAAFRAERNSAS